jgi:hypothetical protein
MGTLDLLVVASLGLMASWPFIANGFSYALASLKPRPASPAADPAGGSSNTEEWRQAWAFTLIRLIDDIEGGKTHFENEAAARKLARDLLWEIIGGDGPTPSKSK